MSLSNCFSKIFGKKKKDDSGKKMKAGSTISQRTKEEKNPSAVSVVKDERKASTIDTLKSFATQSPHTPTTSSTPNGSRSTTTTPRTRSTTPAESPNGDDYHLNHHHHNGKHRRSKGKSSKRSRLGKRRSGLSSRRHQNRHGASESSKRKAESKRSSLSDRGIRVVKKKMVSRPIKDSALKKMAERVEARRQDTPKKPLKTGDLFFPKKKSSKNSTTGTTEDLTKNTMQAFAKASFSRLPKRVESTREYIPVKNNDNGGKLFVKNKEGKTVPFWKEDPPEAGEEAEDDTEDDMVLNADAVLDVLNGTLQLAEAPDVEVLFDPDQPLDSLQKKDDLFFTPPLLLGNSLRSMINLTEPPGQSELFRAAHQKKRRKSKKEMKFEQPAKVTLYDAEKPAEHKQRPWKPSGKKIVY